MNLEHNEYLALQERLQDHFDGRYRQIKYCDKLLKVKDEQIEKLENGFNNMQIEQAKTNTRLGIVIGIWSVIAVPIVALCVKLLFGS